MPSVAPQSDPEAKRLVRTLTNYDDTEDELTDASLQGHLDIAKLELYNEVGTDAVYSDAGLGQALVAATAIYAKAAVENYSVSSWSVGDMNVSAGAFKNPENAQFMKWGKLHAGGLQSSDKTPTHAPRNTAGYIGDPDPRK